MIKVACIGLAVIDTIFSVGELPLAKGKTFARSMRQVGGGIAANAAVTVSALGGRGVLIGRVGGDVTGRQILAELDAWHVDVRAMHVVDDLTSPISTVLIEPSGERQIINHLDPGLLDNAEEIDLAPLREAGALMTDLRWPTGSLAALAEARRLTLPSLVDFEIVPKAPDPDFLTLPSHLAFSQEGLAHVAETSEVETGLRWVKDRTEAWAAVTCGAKGLYWLDGDELRHLPAFKVEVVDTLAAGDVFHGALALALAERRPMEAALRFASAAAAVKCTRFGGRDGIPDRAAVEMML